MSLSETDLIRRGVDLFNRGEFFECHEVLEQVWLQAREPRKLFLQGLIQLAVGSYHLRRGNLVGAQRLLHAGAAKLNSTGTSQNWIDSAALLAAVGPILDRIDEAKPGDVFIAELVLPTIRFAAAD